MSAPTYTATLNPTRDLWVKDWRRLEHTLEEIGAFIEVEDWDGPGTRSMRCIDPEHPCLIRMGSKKHGVVLDVRKRYYTLYQIGVVRGWCDPDGGVIEPVGAAA